MKSLHIEATEFSPRIYFDPQENKFEISGESRPENTSKFYSKLILWLDELNLYFRSNPASHNLIFDFKFDYFNSTSAKFILDFLQKLETVGTNNINSKVYIHWYYDEKDEDMRESGEEFSHLVKLPFEFKIH